jgi:hypothetical protein
MRTALSVALTKVVAGVDLGLGEFDNQNRVLRRQADGCQQADLEVHVVGQAATAGGQQRTDDA